MDQVKAFDTLGHFILIDKFDTCGVSRNYLIFLGDI